MSIPLMGSLMGHLLFGAALGGFSSTQHATVTRPLV